MGNVLRSIIAVLGILGVLGFGSSPVWAQSNGGFGSSDKGLINTIEGLGGYLRLVEGRVRAAPAVWARFSYYDRNMGAGGNALPQVPIDVKEQEMGTGLTLTMEAMELAATLSFYDFDGDPDSEFTEKSSEGTGDIWLAGKYALETSVLGIAPYGKFRLRTGDENTDSLKPAITQTNPVFVPQSNFQMETGLAATVAMSKDGFYLHGNVAYFRQDPENFGTLQGAIYRGGASLLAPGLEFFGYWEGHQEFEETLNDLDSRFAAGVALNLEYQNLQFTITGGYERLLDGNATGSLLGRLDIEDEGFYLTVSLPLFN